MLDRKKGSSVRLDGSATSIKRKLPFIVGLSSQQDGSKIDEKLAQATAASSIQILPVTRRTSIHNK